MRIKMAIIVLLCCLWGSVGTANCQENDTVYRVVFSTFDVGSAGKYGYLQNSIQSMLVARLAANDRVEILEHTLSAKEVALLKKGVEGRDKVVQPVAADYLLMGALFSIKSGLSVNVTLYPFSQEKSVLHFSFLMKDVGVLISEVEQLSQQITNKIFGSNILEPYGKAGNKVEKSGFITVHPEVAYKRGLYVGSIVSESDKMRATAVGAKRTIDISGEISAITVGDLDKDGQEEVLVLSQGELKILGLTEDGFDLLDKVALPKGKRSHALSIADINADGVQEIYISATKDLDVSSMILEWRKGSGFTLVANDVRWYLRAVKNTQRQCILMGQKRGLEKNAFLQSGLYQLKLNEKYKVAISKKIFLPSKANLFNFIYADLDGVGTPEIVVIDNREKMRIYNSNSELLWISKKSFGGSSIYLGPSQGDAVNDAEQWGLSVDEESDREPIFVPNPIMADDIDQNGSQELIVNENQSVGIKGFYKLRIYNSSRIVSLSWNGENMEEIWRTGEHKGVISAYSFSSKIQNKRVEGTNDTINKYRGRLYTGYIPKKGTLWDLLPGSLDSELKVYELEFTKRAEGN